MYCCKLMFFALEDLKKYTHSKQYYWSIGYVCSDIIFGHENSRIIYCTSKIVQKENYCLFYLAFLLEKISFTFPYAMKSGLTVQQHFLKMAVPWRLADPTFAGVCKTICKVSDFSVVFWFVFVCFVLVFFNFM